jgi:hypothetical protein
VPQEESNPLLVGVVLVSYASMNLLLRQMGKTPVIPVEMARGQQQRWQPPLQRPPLQQPPPLPQRCRSPAVA